VVLKLPALVNCRKRRAASFLADDGQSGSLREQKSSHILNVTSVGGQVSFPTFGMYHDTKYAIEGISESLAMEVAPFRNQSHHHRAGRVQDRLCEPIVGVRGTD
jgi:NAD(P)-dependent dehydrogenase (short-subunit alcohol dehydrogenase family)